MVERLDLPGFMRGDTWANTLSIFDEEGEPLDIAGWRFWLTLKLDPTVPDTEAPAQVWEIGGFESVGLGMVTLTLLPEETEKLIPATYSYDIQAADLEENIRTLFYGKVPVLMDITRSRI